PRNDPLMATVARRCEGVGAGARRSQVKYITSQFEVRFSATIYLVCFCFFKQLAMIFMSVLAGNMYESIGFQGAYLVLGLVALGFTLISVFTLSGPGPLSLLRRQVNEVA
ncbi:MFS transporter, partial [Escherichia coli]|uniref:MFS transporter n=1 Tax=Escherichia coli TaxID=562 RepID=UPI0020191CB0